MVRNYFTITTKPSIKTRNIMTPIILSLERNFIYRFIYFNRQVGKGERMLIFA